MKIKKFSFILLLLILIFIISKREIAKGIDNRIFTIYYFERLPYYHKSDQNNGNEPSKPEGFLMEITEKIFNLANIKHKYVLETPKRILQIVKKYETAVSVGWFKTKERENNYKFSIPLYQDKPYVIVVNRYKKEKLPSNPTLDNILKSDLILGVIDGFSYGELIDKKILEYNPEKITFPYIYKNILELISSFRCDYTFMNYEEAYWIIKNDDNLSLKIAIVKINNLPFSNKRYLIFNKNVDLKILEDINNSILNFKKRKEYKTIIEKYF